MYFKIIVPVVLVLFITVFSLCLRMLMSLGEPSLHFQEKNYSFALEVNDQYMTPSSHLRSKMSALNSVKPSDEHIERAGLDVQKYDDGDSPLRDFGVGNTSLTHEMSSPEDVLSALSLMQASAELEKHTAINQLVSIGRFDLDTTLYWLSNVEEDYQASYYQAILNDAQYDMSEQNTRLLMTHFSDLSLELVNRSELIADFSYELAKNDIHLAINWLDSIEQDAVVSAVQTAVLSKWAQVAPERALNYVVSNHGIDQPLERVIIQNSVAYLSSAEAHEYLERLHYYSEQTQLMMVESLVGVIAEHEPEKIEVWFRTQPKGPTKDVALLSYVRQYTSALSNDELLQYAGQFDNPSLLD